MQWAKVVIVIPCKTMDAYVKRCVEKCLDVDYPNYEVLVLPDHDLEHENFGENVHVISTGPIKPLSKRFTALSASDGEFYAFIDSDAYPTRGWLKHAIRHFKDTDVAAVVGPTVSPEGEDLMAEASGLILASPLGGGSESIRYRRSGSSIRYVEEAPMCNMVVRRSVLSSVKGHAPDVWPGEEIVFCGIITKGFKKKIVYDSDVLVYHSRRRLFKPHLKQMWSYGVVKGHLLKKYPEYVRPIFVLPSMLVLGVLGGLPLAMLNDSLNHLYVFTISTYFMLSLVNSVFIGLKEKAVKAVPLVFVGTIATHVCYGLAFLKGLLSKRL